MERKDPSHRGTVVITGATSGIGLATAIGIAAAGYGVVLHGRDQAKCESATELVRSAVPGAEPEVAVADLASLSETRELGSQLLSRFPSIHALVNNAGTMTLRRRETNDGLETQFAVNHAAHFLLTLLLLPAIHKLEGGRIVCVSSGTHRSGRMRWNDLQLRRFYNGLTAYAQSKLANILFAYELHRRLSPLSQILSFALEPGLVDTDMGSKGTGPIGRFVWSRRRRHGVSVEQGASTSIYLATAPRESLEGGTYWADRAPADSSSRSHDVHEAVRLWDRCEEICGIRFEDVVKQMDG